VSAVKDRRDAVGAKVESAASKVRLGKIQKQVLRALIEHGRYPGAWLWDTHSNTKRILDRLVEKGVVEYDDRPLTDMFGKPFPEGHPYARQTQRHYRPASELQV
jgi:hypothetical protein